MKLVFKELENALKKYHITKEPELRRTILTLLAQNAMAQEFWHVLAEAVLEPDDETKQPDPETETTLRKLPAFRKQLITDESGKECFCAFTSQEQYLKYPWEGTFCTVQYPLWDLLWEMIETEAGDGLLINFGTDDFLLEREEARDVLRRALELTDWEVHQMRTFHPKPKAVLDTNEILESWKEGWIGRDSAEDWSLSCYPIMADGRILVLFERKDEIYGGEYNTFGVKDWMTHFRLLEYGQEEDGLRLIGKYRFRVQSPRHYSVMLYDGVLKAILRQKDGDMYTVLPIFPENDAGQFTIYADVERVISNSKGETIVGYNRNSYDEEHLPLMIFDEKGKEIACYFDEDALYCSDVNLDKNEDVWFHMYPSDDIRKLVPKSRTVEYHKVALPGFHAFAMNDDGSLLFLWFSEYEGGSVQYVLSRDENGNYGDPIRFAFLPEDENGKLLAVEKCEEYGRCATMKSWVILNADNKLYLYDMNDCPDLRAFHHREHPCPVCGKHVFKSRDDDEVCPVCGWKDSSEQVLRPNKALKENKMSLYDARRMWKEGTPLDTFRIDTMNIADYDNLKNDEHFCPVCGQYEFEEFGSYDICPYCHWEDDLCPIGEENGEYIYDEEDDLTCNYFCLKTAKAYWSKGIPTNRIWEEMPEEESGGENDGEKEDSEI